MHLAESESITLNHPSNLRERLLRGSLAMASIVRIGWRIQLVDATH